MYCFIWPCCWRKERRLDSNNFIVSHKAMSRSFCIFRRRLICSRLLKEQGSFEMHDSRLVSYHVYRVTRSIWPSHQYVRLFLCSMLLWQYRLNVFCQTLYVERWAQSCSQPESMPRLLHRPCRNILRHRMLYVRILMGSENENCLSFLF